MELVKKLVKTVSPYQVNIKCLCRDFIALINLTSEKVNTDACLCHPEPYCRVVFLPVDIAKVKCCLEHYGVCKSSSLSSV